MATVKILLVEDEMIIAQKIKIILTDMGYEITSIASTGEEAMHKTAEMHLDLVLMDIVIKGDMDGIEAAARIREHSEIPIIYVSAYGDNETLNRARATQPVGYILKPISPDQMRVTIETGLELHISRQKLDKAQRDYCFKLEEEVKKRTDDLHNTNAELARANRLKDEFLANMSHELRTPLTSILGVSEVLIEQVYGPLNEKQVKSLQNVEKSGQHLLNLINDILDLSKIQADKMELQINEFAVEDLCQASLQIVKQAAQMKKQKLNISIDIRLKHMRADIMRIKQILVNLLINAVKFTPDGGKIGLEANCEPDRNIVEFSVWDTGRGISKKNMKKLFKPFVQLDGSFTREHDGSGLGLALVYKLTEMHGGSVNVESEEGRYSRFAVRLPWQPDKELQGFENSGDLKSNASSNIENGCNV
ncbi:ATP-binding protein [Desulfobacterales bacterium HSG17]|nr:ATP-binding protein [Desulfobacterales bacterium HSG17]